MHSMMDWLNHRALKGAASLRSAAVLASGYAGKPLTALPSPMNEKPLPVAAGHRFAR